jgi:hypothetical protein
MTSRLLETFTAAEANQLRERIANQRAADTLGTRSLSTR